jgi:hypothetical protein
MINIPEEPEHRMHTLWTLLSNFHCAHYLAPGTHMKVTGGSEHKHHVLWSLRETLYVKQHLCLTLAVEARGGWFISSEIWNTNCKCNQTWKFHPSGMLQCAFG